MPIVVLSYLPDIQSGDYAPPPHLGEHNHTVCSVYTEALEWPCGHLVQSNVAFKNVQ